MIVIGILLGGMLTALALGEFAIRHIPNGWMLLQALVGGLLLGYGSRLALGCNIGNFFSAWASAGLNAISFTVGMLPGLYLGTKAVERAFLPRARPLVRRTFVPPRNARPLLLALVALLTALLVLHAAPRASLWFIFGVIFGAIGYASRICWATGLRTLVAPAWGNDRAVVAIGLATLVAGIWLLIYVAGVSVSLTLARGLGQVQVLVGGFIFGVGMRIAGSCIFSSEWRAGGGSVYSIVVLASTVLLGMPIFAYHYEWWRSMLPQPLADVSLYNLMGPLGIAPVAAFWLLLVLPRVLPRRLRQVL